MCSFLRIKNMIKHALYGICTNSSLSCSNYLLSRIHECKKPYAIVQPLGPSDVVTAVQFAKMKHLPLSVKGGGHNSAGRCVVHNGLMIDCSKMKGIRVDPIRKTVRAEAGPLHL
jgi:FAD/FMN-containing dehydrogenase